MPSVKPVWYAVYTRSRAEKKVAWEFSRDGIEHYLPLQMTLRKWSDRKKLVEIPLIRSYVFVRISRKEHLKVLLVPGVVKILHFNGRPVPIPDWQIQNLRILLGAAVPISRDFKGYERGEAVEIVEGPLKGLRGRISYIRGQHKLVISIGALDYNLKIDIDPAFVEPTPLPQK